MGGAGAGLATGWGVAGVGLGVGWAGFETSVIRPIGANLVEKGLCYSESYTQGRGLSGTFIWLRFRSRASRQDARHNHLYGVQSA